MPGRIVFARVGRVGWACGVIRDSYLGCVAGRVGVVGKSVSRESMLSRAHWYG